MITSNQNKPRVCVLGMGYVGLTLSVVMAECGYDVVGIEINPTTFEKLTSGTAHFYEAGLDARLQRQTQHGNLRFVNSSQHPDVAKAETFVVTVGTPLGVDDQPRMDMVRRAAGELAEAMPEGALIILRSTVKIGTTRSVVKPVLDASGKAYRLAYCPERTLEGRALEELRRLPQVVGGLNQDDAWAATQIFQRITPTTIRVSSLEAAELVKLLDNSYRDLSFAFGNEVALLCEAAGLDGIEVITAANTGYERTSIARPGFVGGPCLEKDPHILRVSMEQYGFVPQLVVTGRRLNEELPQRIVELLDENCPDPGPTPKIAICGLAFKGRPETDDLRGTPATFLVKAIQQRFPQATIVGQDFAVSPSDIKDFGLEPKGIDDAFRDASIVIIANNNAKYQLLEPDKLMATMAKPGIVFDVWDVLQVDPASTPDGTEYYRLGSARSRGCA